MHKLAKKLIHVWLKNIEQTALEFLDQSLIKRKGLNITPASKGPNQHWIWHPLITNNPRAMIAIDFSWLLKATVSCESICCCDMPICHSDIIAWWSQTRATSWREESTRNIMQNHVESLCLNRCCHLYLIFQCANICCCFCCWKCLHGGNHKFKHCFSQRHKFIRHCRQFKSEWQNGSTHWGHA